MSLLTRRRTLALPVAACCGRLAAMPLGRFPLGVTTDEIDEDLLTAARFLNEFGLRYAEIRSVWGKYNTVQPIERIREARTLLDEHKIRTSVLATPFFRGSVPDDTPEGRRALDEQWKLLDAAMERAAILGTSTLRIFAFTYRGGERPEAGAYPRIYDLLREAARRTGQRRIRLAVENLAGSYVSTAPESARMLAAVRDETLGLTWDPNNAALAGEARPFPDGYRLLDPARILHVHLRDYRHAPDGKVEWCPVGAGEFDNLGQIRTLLKAGYRGGFTLETHYRSPQGKAYSTRVSLTGLLKVVAQV